ncbi:MAG: ATP-binding cassette domain-containing protein [Bryobacteraceae bacterium]
MIQVQQLRKSFDHRTVVRDLSFEAPDGAITGILGANGAGKTTTLRMICGRRMGSRFAATQYRTACGHDLGIFGGRLGVCDRDQPRQLVSFGVGYCRFCGPLIAPLPEQARHRLVRRRLIFV